MQPAFYGHELSVLPYGSTILVGDDIPYRGWERYLDRQELWDTAGSRAANVIYLTAVQDHAFVATNEPAPEDLETVTPIEDDSEALDPELGEQVEVFEVPWELGSDGYTRMHTANLDSAIFKGVRLLEAGSFTPTMVPPLSANRELAQAAREVYLFRGTDRPLVVTAQLGRGTWITVFAAELFANRDIGRADNVVFAYNVAAEAGKAGVGPVYFLESIHGYSVEDTGVLSLLLFTWWGQLALLGLVGAVIIYLPSMFPLGREVETPVVKFPSALLRVRALAEIWRRSPDQTAARKFAVAAALGIEPDTIGARKITGMLQELGYPQVRAAELANELASGEDGRMRAEVIRAYNRLVQRFGRISRFN